MKRLAVLPLSVSTVFLGLSIIACGCGGGGSTDGGAGTGGGLGRFCETDDECTAGSTNECAVASCDTDAGFCISTPLPEGSPCNDASGVCRDGFCAQSELKAYLKSPNPEPNALFGNTVSLLGDRLIVGAPSSGPPFGRVAVFERTAGEWAVVQQIDTPRLPGGSTDGLFAWSVASAEDFFVVGTMGFSLGGSGSVRVFRKYGGETGEWLQDPAFGYLIPSAGPSHPLDLFATSVALTPTGDTLVVGAPGYSGVLPIAFADRDYSGAAYIFENNNSLWSEVALLRASNFGGSYECEVCDELACPTSGEGDGFGAAVGISGDTVVVGAPGEASAATGVNGNGSDDSAPAAGAAYVFERIDGSWEQTAYLKASNTNPGDRFGFAVAIDGDTIVVGAEREDSGELDNQGDNSAIDAGAAYVFERMGGTWEQTQYLKASNVDAGYFFGANLALSGTTLVVGSPGEGSVGGPNSGAAYVFSLVDGAWTQTNFYKAFNADADSEFAGPPGSVAYGDPNSLIFCEAQATTKGVSLSLSGDTLIVGAPYEDSAAVGVNGVPTSNSIPDSGAVYVFDNSEGQ
jgi:FG-GAP repeat